jgi:hypothetical protein
MLGWLKHKSQTSFPRKRESNSLHPTMDKQPAVYIRASKRNGTSQKEATCLAGPLAGPHRIPGSIFMMRYTAHPGLPPWRKRQRKEVLKTPAHCAYWIPAFAGMTKKESRHSSGTPCMLASRFRGNEGGRKASTHRASWAPAFSGMVKRGSPHSFCTGRPRQNQKKDTTYLEHRHGELIAELSERLPLGGRPPCPIGCRPCVFATAPRSPSGSAG